MDSSTASAEGNCQSITGCPLLLQILVGGRKMLTDQETPDRLTVARDAQTSIPGAATDQ